MIWYVYIMTNKPNGVLYIGVTDNLDERVKEHKLKVYPKSFTAKYNCDRLIYFEQFDLSAEAIVREKRFKKWKRQWKIELIEEMNSSWADLSDNWRLDLKKTRKLKRITSVKTIEIENKR